MQVILHTTVFKERMKRSLYFREKTLISLYNIKVLPRRNEVTGEWRRLRNEELNPYRTNVEDRVSS